MAKIKLHYQTTIAGAAAVALGIVQIIHGQLDTGCTSICAGLGLIFSADAKSA